MELSDRKECNRASTTTCASTFLSRHGVFDQADLNCAIAELGIDNILFSVHDPFGDNFECMDFLNNVQLSEVDRGKLAHGNEERVLNLSSGSNAALRNPSRSFYSFEAKFKARLARVVGQFEI